MDFSKFQLREEGLIQHFENELTCQQEVKIKVARLDWIHTKFGGNKWFKLQPHLDTFSSQKHSSIISFGGPFSNHLISLAAICNELQIPCVGIIRSSIEVNNPTIAALRKMQMKLVFLPKTDFDHFTESERTDFIEAFNLKDVIGENPFWIELGGEGSLGVQGASLIWPFLLKNHAEQLESITHTIVSVGKGTTFLGLRQSIPNRIKCIGVSAFKGGEKYVLENEALAPFNNDILNQYAGLGFGKNSSEDLTFYQLLINQHQLDLDIVYTGKTFKALLNEISLGNIERGAEVLFVHTGGQQGNPKA
jgi:1-aminocyclopropane-1-carboxylate deaminase